MPTTAVVLEGEVFTGYYLLMILSSAINMGRFRLGLRE